jgi:glycerophosphoryl diester phosphodiesterase
MTISVNGFTAERSQNIEDTAIVDGDVVGDNLILKTREGAEIDAGNVRGPQGIQGLPGNDGVDGELTEAAGDIRYRKKPNFVDNLVYPFFIAHRGAHLIYPEHSLEAFSACVENGWPIEPDCQMLSDGTTIAICHDATTTRTMQQIEQAANSTVSSISRRNWMRNYKVLPEIAGGEYGRTTHLAELLDLFGGQVLIVPEIKVTAARVPVCDAIVNRGLERACIVQSFDEADCTYAVSRGIEAMMLNPTKTAAQLLALGIKFAGCPESATDAYVDGLIAGGVKVARYTYNSKSLVETTINANRGSIYFTDDPDWAFGRRAVSYTDPFAKKLPWPHMVGPSGGPRENFRFASAGLEYKLITTGFGTMGVAMDWCPPIVSGKTRVYFDWEFGDGSTSQTRWLGIAFGKFASTEEPMVDAPTASQTVFHALIRRNGVMEMFHLTPSASTSVATFTGASAFAAAGLGSNKLRFMFERNATNVLLKNLTTGDVVTYANATLQTSGRLQFNWNGTEGILSNVRVEEIA